MKPWGKFRLGDRIVILGLPLSGKSRLAAKLTQDADRVIYFDPMSDYESYAAAKKVSIDELTDNLDLVSVPKFRIAIVPDSDDIENELERTIEVARSAGNVLLVFDEVGDYRLVGEHMLNRVSRTGRHDGIVPVYVSQVATDIPLTVRRLATRVFSFLQYFPRDLKALAETYGEEFSNKVAKLKKGEMAEWTLPTLSLISQTGESESPQTQPQSLQSSE